MNTLLLNIFPNFAEPSVWAGLLTLTFLEIVLGVDNIIFISIIANKLEKKKIKRATRLGLLLAMGMRILLLLGVNWLIGLKDPVISFNTDWISGAFSIQSLILIAGGLFLLYKSTSEIHHKLDKDVAVVEKGARKHATMGSVIFQIILIDIVFSIDSILTAVGMTNGTEGALGLMIIAVIVSIMIMMAFANPVADFINKNPTVQMLALSFLLMIGFMLIAEGAHIADFSFGGVHVGTIPKGYLYFSIAFSLGVEMLNMRLRKRSKPVQLNNPINQAKEEGQ